MSLTDLIVNTAILDGCESLDKTGVVHRLLLGLAIDGHLDPASVPSVFESVMRRESLGSTGIGQRIAIPHTRHSAVRQTLAIMAVCRPPVDSDNIDGELTDIFILLFAPPDRPGFELRPTSRSTDLLLRGLRNAEFQK